MIEEWKDIPGYEGLYKISNFGNFKKIRFINNICNIPKEKYISKKYNNKGYEIVILYKNGTSKTKLLHRIVASLFLSNYSKDLEVNHKDGNKKNNNVSNLEMVTRKENVRHAINNNLWISPNKNRFGSASYKALKVEMLDKDSEKIIKKFNSIIEASMFLGKTNSSNIVCCLKGKSKTAYGYKWRYSNG